MRVRVDLRLPEELVLEADRLAEDEGTTRTAIVERALEAALVPATRGDSEPTPRASKIDYTPIPKAGR